MCSYVIRAIARFNGDLRGIWRDTCPPWSRGQGHGGGREGIGKKERYLQGELIVRRNVCCTIDAASGNPLL